MTAARTESVVSPLLSDPAAAPATTGPSGRIEPSADYRATVAAGYLETDVDAWAARVFGGQS